MFYKKYYNIDDETISKLGLRISTQPINASIAPESRVFEHPDINDVFLMESDLYGNPMPGNSCFLAFQGRNGLMGRHLYIEELRKLTKEDIEKIISNNSEG